jgi:hypothetical protein
MLSTMLPISSGYLRSRFALLSTGGWADVVRCLIPAENWRRLPGGESPWLRARLALQAALEKENDGGVVLLLSAFLSAAFRASFQATLRERELGNVVTQGRNSPDLELIVWRTLGEFLADGWDPWEQEEAMFVSEGTELDLCALDELLGDYLEVERATLSLLYFDDSLLRAALFALIGNAVSAKSCLGSAPRTSLCNLIRAGLWHRVTGGQHFSQGFRTLVESCPLSKERQEIYHALQKTPDPSLALGTPYWTAGENLGGVAATLVRTGKMSLLRSVRTVLQRQDLRERVEPFWILHKKDERDLLAALRWAATYETYPPLSDWLPILDGLAQEVLEEGK